MNDVCAPLFTNGFGDADLAAWGIQVDLPKPRYSCNAGFPMSRTRNQAISLTLLGDTKRFGCWERLEIVYVRFPDRASPRQWCLQTLKRFGCSRPEDLLAHVQIPGRSLHARQMSLLPNQFESALAVGAEQDPLKAMRAALILGKCTEDFFDPERPAIWSDRCLVRAMALYEPGNFYAD